MELNLTRPLAFFDLETTGTDVAKDRIVEICIIKVMPDGTETTYLERLNHYSDSCELIGHTWYYG
jgi:DNA polymerase III subunit epsilon